MWWTVVFEITASNGRVVPFASTFSPGRSSHRHPGCLDVDKSSGPLPRGRQPA
jgi:hypothetical protein